MDTDMAMLKSTQTRLVFTDAPGAAMPEHKGKVFALIGPFDSFQDNDELQLKLEALVREYNHGHAES
jgi:hypothetical protein